MDKGQVGLICLIFAIVIPMQIVPKGYNMGKKTIVKCPGRLIATAITIFVKK